jgi:hypothetical protein
MSHFLRGSHGDPNLNENSHIRPSTLHEAKLAAWAFAIGEAPFEADRSGGASHRGLMSDLPPPEPVRRVPLWSRLLMLFGRASSRAEAVDTGRFVTAHVIHHPSAAAPAADSDTEGKRAA